LATPPKTPPSIDHLDCGAVVGGTVGSDAANLEQEAREAAHPEHQLEIGGAERAFAGLVDEKLAIGRRLVGNDHPAGLAARQDGTPRRGRGRRRRLLSGASLSAYSPVSPEDRGAGLRGVWNMWTLSRRIAASTQRSALSARKAYPSDPHTHRHRENQSTY
jgi:hypothetical protein